MKKTLLFLAIFLSQNSLADQSDLLAKARDHYLDLAVDLLKSYCLADLPKQSTDSTYICRQQIELDCVRQQKNSCATLSKLKSLEAQAALSDKNLAQTNPRPLYSSKPLKQPTVEISTPTYRQITVVHGSMEPTSREAEVLKEFERIRALASKLNTLRYRVDCTQDEECQIQDVGAKICGGPISTFAYSTKGGESASFIAEVKAFNTADRAFMRAHNSDRAGLCDWNGRSTPSKCEENACN